LLSRGQAEVRSDRALQRGDLLPRRPGSHLERSPLRGCALDGSPRSGRVGADDANRALCVGTLSRWRSGTSRTLVVAPWHSGRIWIRRWICPRRGSERNRHGACCHDTRQQLLEHGFLSCRLSERRNRQGNPIASPGQNETAANHMSLHMKRVQGDCGRSLCPFATVLARY
jgi:hypothetical protein